MSYYPEPPQAIQDFLRLLKESGHPAIVATGSQLLPEHEPVDLDFIVPYEMIPQRFKDLMPEFTDFLSVKSGNLDFLICRSRSYGAWLYATHCFVHAIKCDRVAEFELMDKDKRVDWFTKRGDIIHKGFNRGYIYAPANRA